MTTKPVYDIAIIGGGMAGTCAAWAFQRAGLSVVLVDERAPHSAPIFRAERISNQAYEKLTNLGLESFVDRVALPLHNTAVVKGSKIEKLSTQTDYALTLHCLVNEIKEALQTASGVTQIADQAVAAEYSTNRQRIELATGATLDCRLLVVATGASSGLLKSLGVSTNIISKNHSATFGFDIKPGVNFGLPSTSITVRICKDGADYMTLFPKPEGGYRANLFTYWGTGDPRQKAFLKGNQKARLQELIPGVTDLIGSWDITGKIACGSVNVLKSANFQKPGFVLIGDAYGRVCPCAGRGIHKLLMDIETLINLAPGWIKNTTSLTAEELDLYYHDDARSSFENWVFNDSLMMRSRVTSRHPKWLVRRFWYHHTSPAIRDAYWNYWGSRKMGVT